MELLKLLNANQIVAQIICFLVLFFLLRRYAWKPLLSLLDHRRERIAAEFKNIADMQAQLAQHQAEYQEKLAAIEETARLRAQEVIGEGRKAAAEIRAKAHDEARAIAADAKANIRLEIARAKEELKNSVVDLTVEATERIIGEKLTEEKDKKLIRGFVEDMGHAK